MKVSKYTVLFSDNGAESSSMVFYAYNILSNAFVEIDEELFKLLEQNQTSNAYLENSDLADIVDESVLDILIDKRFIVENDADDFSFYKDCILKQRSETSIMHLTIAPTMDCCFNCFYCFEEHKTRKYMDERTMNAILSYLKSLVSKPDFRLTWFGGEPLMAIEQMRILYSKLSSYYKPPIDSNVITTGYHLDENAIQVLKEMNVKEVQITLDGSKERHNKIKSLDGTVDVFERVLDNAERLLKESNIKVSFRINLTKENMYEFIPLYKYLVDRFKFSYSKSVSPAFVMDRSHNKGKKGLFLTHSEMANFVLELQSKYHIYTPFIAYPSNLFNECAIRNVMSVSFDPEGYAYKCWEYIGNKKYSFGVLNGKGEIVNVNEEWLSKQLYDADPLTDPVCSKCKYLPLCSGGCPIQRLENKYDNASNNCCTLYKLKLEEFLKLHIKLKGEK